jgi:hypothetical protein
MAMFFCGFEPRPDHYQSRLGRLMTEAPTPGVVPADRESQSPELSTNCGHCGRKLRDALFCPRCGERLCCSSCLDLHLAAILKHPNATGPPRQENESGH